MISMACATLLAHGSNLHPLYGNRLANHLPMALVALDRMGADRQQLERFASHYATRLVKRSPHAPALEPRGAFGERNSFEGVHSYFVERLAACGIEPVLQQWVPQLIPGLSASAFHALIRLAYGLDAGSAAEIAAGLAYWVSEYQALGPLGRTTDQTLQQIAQSTRSTLGSHVFKPGIIVDRMAEICGHPAVQQASTQPLHIQHGDVARFALEVYAEREDFTLLHTVTACHAFALLAPHAGDLTTATRYLWQAILVASLTVQRDEPSTATQPPTRSWEDCLRTAVTSLDDHVIKLVYTAWRGFQETQDPRYLYLASRKTLA